MPSARRGRRADAMSAPPLTNANRPADALAAMPAHRRSARRPGRGFRDGDRRAERPDRTGRVEATLAQVRRARGPDILPPVAGDHRFDQLRARNAALVADAEGRRNDRAAAMRRTDAIAVVEFDAVRRCRRGMRVEDIMALRAAGHRDVAALADAGQHRLGVGCTSPGRPRSRRRCRADGARVIAHFVGKVRVGRRWRRPRWCWSHRPRDGACGLRIVSCCARVLLSDRIRSRTGSK